MRKLFAGRTFLAGLAAMAIAAFGAVEARADKLQKEKRLILLGYGNFRAEHEQAHALLDKLKAAHEYRDEPDRKHDWHSGWVKEAAEMLVAK